MQTTTTTRSTRSAGPRWARAALLALLAAAVVAAGCGDEDDPGVSAQASNEGPVPVKMAYMATASDAAMVLGEKKGFFEEAGVDLQLEQVPTTGAAAIPAVLNGEFQAAGGGIDAPIIAAGQGLPVKILASDGVPVSKGDTYPADAEEGTSAIVVPEDSDVQEAADLAGRKMAAITVHGLQYLCIAGALEKQGVGTSDVKILEIPPSDMLAALEAGRVEGAALVEPFLTIAKQEGYRVVSYPCEESIPGAVQAGFYTSAEWAEKNPEALSSLVEGLVRSNQYAEEHPEELRKVIPEYTKISAELAEKITLSRYDTEKENTLGAVADAVKKYELVEQLPDLGEIMANG